MSPVPFPRTEVAGMSLSRMIMGTNWLIGYSHTSASADHMITAKYSDVQSFQPVLETYLKHGVDTIMAPFARSPLLVRAIHDTEDKTGQGIIMIDTPITNMDDNADARKEAEGLIRKGADAGASFCLIHHASAEQLVDKNKGVLHRIGDYTSMIRDAGLIPGLSAHMPEMITYADDNGYDIETYIQIYNCMGFMMQIEVESVATIIHHAKKPVMTIKPMAAGRCTPYVGLSFTWNTIRDCDLVAVGCHSSEEVEEDVEISRAALEHRLPGILRRASPADHQAVLGNS